MSNLLPYEGLLRVVQALYNAWWLGERQKHTQFFSYKGVASYQSMRKNDEVVEDLVWYYPEPLPEAQRVKDHPCFYDEKVEIEVDGQK